MQNQNQPIAKEGFPFIGLFAFITLIFALLDWGFLTLLLLALTLFTIYFFRNPERVVPEGEGLVVAPADGDQGSGSFRASGYWAWCQGSVRLIYIPSVSVL